MATINYNQEVYNIFKDYFGEDKVELQLREEDDPENVANIIIVYYPYLTITNEEGRSVDVQDLFVKVPLTTRGSITDKFKLKRTTFTKAQAQSHYTHSHIPSGTHLGSWGSPCLGTGPLNMTIDTLKGGSFDERKPFWELFCRELDDYVQTESIAGVPYIRMSTIGINDNARERRRERNFFYEQKYKILYGNDSSRQVAKALLASNKLRWNYIDGNIQIAMSDTDFLLLASRTAYFSVLDVIQRTHPDKPLNQLYPYAMVTYRGLFCTQEGFLRDGFIYTNGAFDNTDYTNGEGTIKQVFKGREFPLVIIRPEENNDAPTPFYLLTTNEAEKIRNYVTFIINVSYGKQNIAEDTVFV